MKSDAGAPGPWVGMAVLRLALGLSLVLGRIGPAGAGPDEGRRALEVLRSPDVTVSAGAVLPLFLLYELPGPWAAVTAGWQLSERAQVVASADLGVLAAHGARRYLGSIGAGVRVAPWRRGPLWGQLGVGATGYVERIGVVLPERMVSATDAGGVLTVDLAVGVRIRRWEIAVGYDHVVAPRPFYKVYAGSESLPFTGTGMVWIGRQL